MKGWWIYQGLGQAPLLGAVHSIIVKISDKVLFSYHSKLTIKMFVLEIQRNKLSQASQHSSVYLLNYFSVYLLNCITALLFKCFTAEMLHCITV